MGPAAASGQVSRSCMATPRNVCPRPHHPPHPPPPHHLSLVAPLSRQRSQCRPPQRESVKIPHGGLESRIRPSAQQKPFCNIYYVLLDALPGELEERHPAAAAAPPMSLQKLVPSLRQTRQQRPKLPSRTKSSRKRKMSPKRMQFKTKSSFATTRPTLNLLEGGLSAVTLLR